MARLPEGRSPCTRTDRHQARHWKRPYRWDSSTIPAVTREKKSLSNRCRLQRGVQIDPSLKILFWKNTRRRQSDVATVFNDHRARTIRCAVCSRPTQTISTRKKDDRHGLFFFTFSHNFVWTYYRCAHSTPGKWRWAGATGGSAARIRIKRNYDSVTLAPGVHRTLFINHTTVFGTLSMCQTAIVLNTFVVVDYAVSLADPEFSYHIPLKVSRYRQGSPHSRKIQSHVHPE